MRITKSAVIALLVGLLLVAGIGIWYKLGVEPGIPVWAEGNKAVEWPRERLPLKVWCESDQDDCRAAVNLWNDAADCPFLLWVERPDGADVRIVNGSANDPERGDAWEKTFASKTGDQVNYVEVRLYEPPISLSSPYSIRYAVNAHGISHGLGLAHTTFGITRAVLSGTNPYPRVVDKHGRALQERYCEP
jgi:hypothetical protein